MVRNNINPQKLEHISTARELPNAIEPELSIISNCLQEPKNISELVNLGITSEHFYLPAHGIIFDLIIEMKAKGHPVSLVTVHQTLADKNILDSVGGASALVDLSSHSPSTAHFLHYAEIVKEKYGLRKLIAIANETIGTAFSNERYTEITASLRKELQKTDQLSLPVSETTFSEEMDQWTHNMKTKIENPSLAVGTYCGLPQVNSLIRGLKPEDFIVVAAKPSQGKSALMLQMGLAAAAAGDPVLVISYEMSRNQILDRWCACASGVEMDVIQSPEKATESELNSMRTFAKNFKKMNVTIKGSEIRELSMLVAYIEKWTSKNPLGKIILDYVQLVKVKGSKGKTEEIESTTRELKDLTQRCQCTIISGSQLNKEGVVKGSESIWEDASILFRIVVDKASDSPKGLHNKKNRNGPSGETIPVRFDKPRQRFVELEE